MRTQRTFLLLYISIITFGLVLNLKHSLFHSKTLIPSLLIPRASAFVPTLVTPKMMDPDLSKSWLLRSNSAIGIHEAWKLSQGDKRIVVAIIDTGVDLNHSDLKENFWHNPKEIPNNGLDDDHNGLIDDILGWDFVHNTATPYDEHGHGTHVTGIIGAVKGNGIGISGICPYVSLMILKYYAPNSSGRKNLENTVRAFQYAIDNGAHIINYSGGGAEYSKEEHDMIVKAQEKGILVVAAAGNEKNNADEIAYYPASYDLDNIISVAALQKDGTLVHSSNFGVTRIDVAAPGYQIYSTLPNNQYGMMTGTSQATAVVTGIAALTLSKYGKLPATKIKELILASVNPMLSLKAKIKSGGSVNALTSLERADHETKNTF
ncbi:MAG: S8 family serine peptidase [Deltaproteobacteria bacterium]|nr:S8 family serine peptidase [Deltaproteobacteria bacterium]